MPTLTAEWALSPRGRLRLGFALAYTALVLAALIAWTQRAEAPPQISGVLLAEPKPLAPFSLIDHRGHHFGNENLRGRWHLVSYGFTTCPDVCPTLLSTLAQLQRQLGGEEQLQVLFYSVDYRRDTAPQLASYLPFFDAEFIGLTHREDPQNRHLPFEQSLGITARLEPLIGEDGRIDPQDYRVSHGLRLFLLNPRGELQAVFRPSELAPGVHGFEPRLLLRDYRAIRAYTG